MSLSMTAVRRMFGLAGGLGALAWWRSGSMLTGMLVAVAGCALTALVWALTDTSVLDGAFDTRPGTLVGHVIALVSGVLLTVWMVGPLGFPLVESALTVVGFGGMTYATYLWMEPNRRG